MVRALWRQGRWFEYLMAFAVLALIVRAMYWLYTYGYFPQPFFYEASDTYMDWFNTAYWAHAGGAYDVWLTIYPPLSFVVLKFLGNPACYVAEGLETRDCDWMGIVAFHAFFVVNIVLTAWTFFKMDRRTSVPRAIALSAGMPMLCALERGNVLLMCYTAMILAYGPIIRSARWRWLFAGIAVNFKVYLIGAVVAQLLKRRWLWCEGALIATVLVYLVSYGLYGEGTPAQIYRNITDYSSGFVASRVLDVWFGVTYQPVISLLQGNGFPITQYLGSDIPELGLVLLPLFTRLGQVSIVLAAAATWLRPGVVPTHRLAFFGVVIALISSEAGGYTEIMVILLTFMEKWRGIARPIAIIAAYILCLPADIPIGAIPPFVTDGYMVGHSVEVHFDVGLGMFVRPGLVILTAICISASTLHDVWRDIRARGWAEGGSPLKPWLRPAQ